jgi:hypothetical protein
MQNNPVVLSGLVAGRIRDGRCRYDPQVKQELVGQCMLLAALPLAQTADDYEALLPWNLVLPAE